MAITVGVAGITGKFAKPLVQCLLKYPDVKVKGLCRNPSKLSESIKSDSRVAIVEADAWDTKAIKSFATGCDVVVCTYLGDDSLMIDGQKILIDACEEAGVARYVASDWSMDWTKLELGELPQKDPMIKIKAYLETKEKVKGVHILVGAFIEPFFFPPYGSIDTNSNTFTFWGTGEEIWEGTTYGNAAEFTVAICVDRNAVGVQRVLGDRVKTTDIIKSYEKVYGVRPQTKSLGSLDDLYRNMHDTKRKDPENLFSYIFMFFTYYMLSGKAHCGPKLDNHNYPQVKPVSWEDFMKSAPKVNLANAYMAL